MVTPSFNQAPFLEAAIRSVFDQDYPALEYVVMDGGSTDGSIEIIRRHETRLTWTSGHDRGQYAAVADGFTRTRGEILGWLNSDDAYTPWAFSVVAEIFAQFPEIEWLTTTRPLFWDARGRVVRCEAIDGFSQSGFFAGEHLPDSSSFGLGCIQQESTFWRRSLWERAGGFDPDFPLAGDFALWARLFEHAELFAVNVPLAGFRAHGTQKTGADFSRYVEEAERALQKYGGRPRGVTWRVIRELARRAPAVCWPALATLGWMHGAKLVTQDPRRGGWTIEKRFI
ncbi:MAG TPA: glycosyltransferase family 2 protein [Chthoniobacteraceae bacterium]|nr:glycosyltransferase family 2 protein [Chthoniobacteraceae bacterium]